MSYIAIPRKEFERLVAAVGQLAHATVALPRNADTAAVIGAAGMVGGALRNVADTMREIR